MSCCIDSRSTEEVFDPRWEYDKDAMREWESFIKQSKSAQVSQDKNNLTRRCHCDYLALDLVEEV